MDRAITSRAIHLTKICLLGYTIVHLCTDKGIKKKKKETTAIDNTQITPSLASQRSILGDIWPPKTNLHKLYLSLDKQYPLLLHLPSQTCNYRNVSDSQSNFLVNPCCLLMIFLPFTCLKIFISGSPQSSNRSHHHKNPVLLYFYQLQN